MAYRPPEVPFAQFPQTAYHSFHYVNESGSGIRVYISFDSLPPYGFLKGDYQYTINPQGIAKLHGPGAALDKGDYYFRQATTLEMENDRTTFFVVCMKERGGQEAVYNCIDKPADESAQNDHQ